jgi:hypothetical protein
MYKRDNMRLKQHVKTVEEELDAVIVLSAEAAEAVPELRHNNDLAAVVTQVADRRARGAAGSSSRYIMAPGATGTTRPHSAASGSSRQRSGGAGAGLRPSSAAALSRPLNLSAGDMQGERRLRIALRYSWCIALHLACRLGCQDKAPWAGLQPPCCPCPAV